MAVRNDKLQCCENQDAEIDHNVLSEAIHVSCRWFMSLHIVCIYHILSPPARFLMTQIQKIDERYDEHPNQVHEVPVQAGDLQVIGVVTAAFVSDSHGKQGYHAGANVQQVEAGDAEEGRAKKSGAPRIVKHGHAFT